MYRHISDLDSEFESDLEEKKPGTHIPIYLTSYDDDDEVPSVKKQKFHDGGL